MVGYTNTTDRKLLEELAMAATEKGRAAAKALVWEIRRAGFSQLRKTNDGWLYGSGTYRFTIPYAVAQGSATEQFVGELLIRFGEVRSRRDAEYGRPRPVEVDLEVPVQNPDDLLMEPTGDLGGGPPGEGAPEGSTPSTPATETERSAPELPKLVVEGSTPSGLPTPTPNIAPTEGETTMAKKGTRRKGHWPCEKCGREFVLAAHLGKHKKSCTGKQDTSTIATRKAVKQIVKVKVVPPSNGSTMEAIVALQSAFNQLMENVKLMDGELRTYRRENEELRAFKQRASALFEDGPKVPRG